MSTHCDKIAEQMLVNLYELLQYRKYGRPPALSGADKIALKLSWSAFVGGDPTKRGFDIFLKMFRNHPETQKVFSFTKGSFSIQLQNSSRLLFHVTRVVKVIGKVIDNLDTLEEVVPMLRQLGGRHGHSGYNVPARYFPYLGEAMRQLMEELVPNYTAATGALWDKVFDDFLVEQLVIGQTRYGGGYIS